jgi:cyclopropane-fatty-acyl-phospholipid synthase
MRTGRSLLERVACNPINYWAALVTDVVAAAVFGVVAAMWYSGPWLTAIALFAGGIVAWTLFEYLLHRWLLHGAIAAIRREHARHHGQPKATISTPTFVIPICATLVAAALSTILSAGEAVLLTFGIYAGYNYFAIIHHMLHHHPDVLGRISYYEEQVRLHDIHHAEPEVLFGISNSLWDRVFRTFPAR